MDKIKNILAKKGISRNIIFLGAGVVAIAIVYFMFFNNGSSSSVDGLITVSSNPGFGAGGQTNGEVAITSQQFLAELLNIDSIKIDDKIVTNPAFLVLKDLSNPINPDTNPGRVNPFAPLGADSQAVSTQITTDQPTLKLSTSAVLNGTLSISGAGITRWFEYGTTDALGTKTTPTPQASAGIYSENITGLSPDTTYYVKAVASIGGQIISGNLVSWQTPTIKRVTN